jgi:site-specific DNA-methyltransferase (adenine-specific)
MIVLDISEEKAKAYRLADNKLNESEWDMDLVIAELKELSLPMVDLTGFSRKLVVTLDDHDDDVPEVPKVAKSKYGDIYELGDHRIICGDSTKPEDFIRLMGWVKADMVFTDPPYNVNYQGSGKNTTNTIMNDKMGDVQFQAFLTDCFKVVSESIKGGAGLYVFHSPTTQAAFEQALAVNNIEVKSQLIWNKPSAGLGMNEYRAKHEPFFYCAVKGAKPMFYGDRTNTTVIDFHKTEEALLSWAKQMKADEQAGKTTIWTMKREKVQDYVHPTQKPVELVMYALNNSSKVEDIVLDPFLGSGSTLISCEKTNRTCYGSELDPKYADVIVQRWVDYTRNRNIIKNGEPIIW